MTPDQEAQLLDDVRESRDTGREIKQRCDDRCERYQKLLAAYGLDLNGAPGNGEHPGLKGRMLTIEAGYKEVKKAQAGEVKWMRARLSAVIAMGLAVVAKWKYWG